MQITFIRKSARDCAIRCTCDDGAVLAVRRYSRPLGLPHDLAHYVIERELGLAWGFWGLVAAGATFASVTTCAGRKRPHHQEEGQWLIKQHRDDLTEAEALVGVLLDVWRDGASAEAAYRAVLAGCWRRTDAAPSREQVARVYTALNQRETQWLRLAQGETLTVEWPTAPRRRRQRPHPMQRAWTPYAQRGTKRENQGQYRRHHLSRAE